MRTTDGELIIKPEQPKRGAALEATFAAFRHRNYRLFWSGQLVSVTGSWVQNVAHGWLVYELTRSSAKLGIVSAVGSFPMLLLSLFGGVMADRVNRRWLLVVTQTILMLLAFCLGALVITGKVRYEHVLMIAFMSGTANAFNMPARDAFIADIVSREDLMNAVALNSAMFNTARIAGPALAGAVMAEFGAGPCFLINGASFLAVIVGLLLIRTQDGGGAKMPQPPLREMSAGLRYLWQDRDLLLLISAAAVPTLFAAPYMMLMPVFAKDVLHQGPAGLGMLMSATGVGALVGAVVLSALSSTPNKGRILVTGGICFSAFLVGFSLSRWFALSLVMVVGAGWSMVTSNATVKALIQTSSRDEMRGRMMSVYFLMVMGLSPLGSLQAGAVAAHLGAPVAVAAGAVVNGLFSALVMGPRAHRWRDW
ncbi:MAG: MFS transporter [Armatimonadota bacterium]